MNRRSFLGMGLAAAPVLCSSSLPALGLSTRHQSLAQPAPDLWRSDTVTACWIGHSTILINMFGTVIITDPVLFRSVGVSVLGNTFGIDRLTAPSLKYEDIPRPDLVVLSHAHMDHTDLASLEYLTRRHPDEVACICAFNTKDIVADLPWKSCRELDWWDATSVGDVSITAVEVLHNGWRYPWERDRREGFVRTGRSYNGYLLSCRDRSFLFAGDTAFTESMRELRGTTIHTAFMPIGAYDGFSDNHCTPEEAIAMAGMIEAQTIAPIHCQTFRQSAEPFHEPMKRFIQALKGREHMLGWSSIGDTIRTGVA